MILVNWKSIINMSVINNKTLLNGKDPGKILVFYWLETGHREGIPVMREWLRSPRDLNSGWFYPWDNNHLPDISK